MGVLGEHLQSWQLLQAGDKLGDKEEQEDTIQLSPPWAEWETRLGVISSESYSWSAVLALYRTTRDKPGPFFPTGSFGINILSGVD